MSVADINGLFFIDTNILVYTFDQNAPEKQATAQAVIYHALQKGRGVISSQVVQEFFNVALRKFSAPMSLEEAKEYLRQVLMPLCQHYPSHSFYERGLLLQKETGFAFYDSLIVTAAIESKCELLLTEDLQDGRLVQGLTIKNPFALS